MYQGIGACPALRILHEFDVRLSANQTCGLEGQVYVLGSQGQQFANKPILYELSARNEKCQ